MLEQMFYRLTRHEDAQGEKEQEKEEEQEKEKK